MQNAVHVSRIGRNGLSHLERVTRLGLSRVDGNADAIAAALLGVILVPFADQVVIQRGQEEKAEL